MRYRDKQLLKLREEVLDLEDFSESVALNEFTLDDFRIELSNYIASNRKLLEDAPLGLYGVVPPNPEQKVISPDVVFCFKQKGPPLCRSRAAGRFPGFALARRLRTHLGDRRSRTRHQTHPRTLQSQSRGKHADRAGSCARPGIIRQGV